MPSYKYILIRSLPACIKQINNTAKVFATKKPLWRRREQIEAEFKTSRNHPKKWLPFYDTGPWKQMYNQNELNAELVKTLFKDECPFAYTNEGDSYFVSPEMYQSLVAVCRCGRPRRGLHVLKCLQNQQHKYVTNKKEKDNDNNKDIKSSKLPETSNNFVGWPQNKLPDYKKWENTMKYVSPVYDMPGERITSFSYHAIIIG